MSKMRPGAWQDPEAFLPDEVEEASDASERAVGDEPWPGSAVERDAGADDDVDDVAEAKPVTEREDPPETTPRSQTAPASDEQPGADRP
jgi:hypothetical protein